MVLHVESISKSFEKTVVLEDVTFNVNSSECHCLIGKNGSGKSTLINMLIDVVAPDNGRVEYWGKGINDPAADVKKRIGVLPEFNPLVEEFSVQDYLRYVGLIYDLEESLIKQRSEYLLDYFFEEIPSIKKMMGNFSKGMKLKAGICAALIHKPELLILDEPFDGMDVFSANNLVAFLNDYRKQGNSIFISSHDMLFMEKIATHVSLIKETKLMSYDMEHFLTKEKLFEVQVSELLGYNPKEIKEFV